MTLSGKGRKKKKEELPFLKLCNEVNGCTKINTVVLESETPPHNGAKGILSPLSPPFMCRVCVIYYINSVAEFQMRCYNDHHTAMALNCNGKKPHQNRVEWSQVGTCGKKAQCHKDPPQNAQL